MMHNPHEAVSPTIAAPSREEASEQNDPFYYGTRFEISYDEHGKTIYTETPLTQDDFLDPQEGDEFVQGTVHERNIHDTRSIFRYLYRNDTTTGGFCDLKMCWGIETLREPCPDVAVVPHVRNLEEPRGSFDVQTEGTHVRTLCSKLSRRAIERKTWMTK